MPNLREKYVLKTVKLRSYYRAFTSDKLENIRDKS